VPNGPAAVVTPGPGRPDRSPGSAPRRPSSASNTAVFRSGREPEPIASNAPARQPGKGGNAVRLSRSGFTFFRLPLSTGKSPGNTRCSVPGTRSLAALRWGYPRGWWAESISNWPKGCACTRRNDPGAGERGGWSVMTRLNAGDMAQAVAQTMPGLT
jgi:hypothetical protein